MSSSSTLSPASFDGIDQEGAVTHAAAALALAGRALDTNQSAGADPAIAVVLLKESVVWVARSFGERPIEGYHDALESLDQGKVLARALGNNGSAKAKLESLDTSSPPASVVADAEISVTKLVECARGVRTTARHERAMRWALGALAVAVLAAVLLFTWLHPWRHYTFQASSAYGSFPKSGQLGDATGRNLLFHTEEENDPWVDVDLRGTRTIHSIVLKNRFDCCQFRGVPLVVEVSNDDSSWVQVAERAEIFDTWKADFAPTKARHLRVRSLGRNVLHLRGIEIR